jgi:hypothetical protein
MEEQTLPRRVDQDVTPLDPPAASSRRTLSVNARRGRRRATTPDAPGDSGDRFRSALRRELERGRRYCRTFALVRVPLPSVRGGRRGWLGRRDHPDDPIALVRSTDIAWKGDGVLYLLLPETDRSEAERCVKRLSTRIEVLPAAAATVVFPDDGVTAGGLLDALHQEGGDPTIGRWAGVWVERRLHDEHLGADVS